ncbi:MAG: ATP-binding protein [Prevotellaceae bacterium]|jgi:predicted ATP-dependent endonuclease of OLD family|nr:ATP-binding protein [Prevotellaceae bacterium]
METFITKIKVNESRRVCDLEVSLCDYERQHLFITGKNGSGKTSLLVEINKFLSQIVNGNYQHYSNTKQGLASYISQLNNIADNTEIKQKLQFEDQIKQYKNWLENFGGVEIAFSKSDLEIHNQYQKGEFLLANFEANRHTNLNVPQGIKKVELKQRYGLQAEANSNFIQYIVNLKADRSFARDEGEEDNARKIDEWFDRLEKQLKSIFDEPSLKLKFDRQRYNFNISMDNCEPFDFNTLSDGYSAIISIVSELLLRMEVHNVKSYDLEGIVLIDEIETHLHVDLQKRIMPFLISFFPKIQFIVTTHSPFVLSSVSNATVCDLENKTVIADLSAYSYDTLLESYFMTDKYSEIVKNKMTEYDRLSSKENKTVEDVENINSLRDYFTHAPKYLAKELFVKLQQIELDNLK